MALFADAHVVPDGNPEPVGREGGRANLITMVAALNAREDIDAVIGIGDLGNAGDVDVDEAAAILAGLNDPFYGALGNHDVYDIGSDWSAQKAASVIAYSMSSNYYAFDVGFARVIVLDTTYNAAGNDWAQSEGFLPAVELTWLENELNTTSQPAKIVCLHHTPNRAWGASSEWFDADDAAALTALVDAHTNTFVFSGHYHPSMILTFYLGDTQLNVLRALCDERYAILEIAQAGSRTLSRLTLQTTP